MVSPTALLRAAHLGPTLAVSTVTALLAVAADLAAGTVATLVAAVLAGQLAIGWANDLVDAGRDRQVGRSDKPLATGALSGRGGPAPPWVGRGRRRGAVPAAGWRSATAHLLVLVGSGLAYNLGLKATAWSWLPYAIAFGTLPAVVTLAADPPRSPLWWVVAAGASLGVGAHFLNALPDLADDAATGVRGLPHRLGGRAAAGRRDCPAGGGVGGRGGRARRADPPAWAWMVLLVVAGLAVVALAGRGRAPFRAAVAIALARRRPPGAGRWQR